MLQTHGTFGETINLMHVPAWRHVLDISFKPTPTFLRDERQNFYILVDMCT